MIGAALVISVAALGAVAAQSATSTAEPPMATTASSAAATEQAPLPSTSVVQAHGFLGVALQDSANGVTVAEVVPGSGAAAAGIQVGDVITAINGTTISSAADATKVVAGLQVGASVTVDLTRSGSKQTVTATLGQPQPSALQVQPANPPGQNPPPGQVNPGGPNIPAAPGRGFGFTYNQADQSWTITNLSSSSPLYTDGLRQGDKITTIDGKTYNPAALIQYLRSLDQSAKVTLSVSRDGQTQSIQVAASDLTALFGRFGGGFFGGNGNGSANGNGANPMTGMAQMSPLIQMMAQAGHLGITYEEINAQVAQANKLTVSDGALVTQVESGSAADKAGLKVNDVITAVDGTQIDAKHPLVYLLLPYQSGDTVTLSVLRAGQSQDVQATLTQAQNMGMGGGMLQFMFPFMGGNGNGPFGGFGGGFPFGGNGRGNGGQSQNQPQATATPNA